MTLEYTITAAAVSRGFADYLVAFFAAIGVALPAWLYNVEIGSTGGGAADAMTTSATATTTSASAMSASATATLLLPAATRADALIDFNLLAMLTALGIGALAVYGGRQSSWVNVVVNVVTIGIVAFCIVFGALYTDTANWTTFAPFGVKGVAKVGLLCD